MDYSGHFFTFGRAQKWSPEQSQGPDLVTVGAVNGVSRGGGHSNIMDTENSEQGAAFKSSLGKLERQNVRLKIIITLRRRALGSLI